MISGQLGSELKGNACGRKPAEVTFQDTGADGRFPVIVLLPRYIKVIVVLAGNRRGIGEELVAEDMVPPEGSSRVVPAYPECIHRGIGQPAEIVTTIKSRQVKPVVPVDKDIGFCVQVVKINGKAPSIQFVIIQPVKV